MVEGDGWCGMWVRGDAWGVKWVGWKGGYDGDPTARVCLA